MKHILSLSEFLLQEASHTIHYKCRKRLRIMNEFEFNIPTFNCRKYLPQIELIERVDFPLIDETHIIIPVDTSYVNQYTGGFFPEDRKDEPSTSIGNKVCISIKMNTLITIYFRFKPKKDVRYIEFKDFIEIHNLTGDNMTNVNFNAPIKNIIRTEQLKLFSSRNIVFYKNRKYFYHKYMQGNEDVLIDCNTLLCFDIYDKSISDDDLDSIIKQIMKFS